MERHLGRHQLAVAAALCAAAVLAIVLSIALLGPGGQDPGTDLEGAALEAVGSQGSPGADTALGILGGADAQAERSELDVAKRAEQLLEGYRERGDCVVARSGYLDLAGKTWGCVMEGRGWVEICLVQEGAEGGSESVVWRMDAGDVPEDVAAEAIRQTQQPTDAQPDAEEPQGTDAAEPQQPDGQEPKEEVPES